MSYYYNPDPPVEFFAQASTSTSPGSAAADPRHRQQLRDAAHRRASAPSILGKHPGLTPFELKNVLYLTANNVGTAR